MIVLNAFAFAGTGAAHYGVVIRRASGSQAVTSNVIQFDTVEHGEAALFDNANDAVIAPGTALMRMRGSLRYAAGMTSVQQIRKNGSTSWNAKGSHSLPNSSNGEQPFFSGIQSVVLGDDFDLLASGTFTMNELVRSWFGADILPSSHRYSQATRTTNTGVIASDTVTTIGFNSDLHDPEGMHDPTTNNHLFQVPSGGPHLCRFRSQMRVASSGGSGELWLFSRYASTSGGTLNPHNGGFFHQTQEAGVDHYVSGVTAVQSVPSGSVFAAGILSGGPATANVIGTQNTWAELEIIAPADIIGVTVLRTSATQSLAPGARKAFGTTDLNTASATLTGDGGIAVPAGASRATVSFNLVGPTDGTAFAAWAALNGSHVAGLPFCGSNGAGVDSVNGESGMIDVSPGDIIDVRADSAVTKTYTHNGECWFCVVFYP